MEAEGNRPRPSGIDAALRTGLAVERFSVRRPRSYAQYVPRKVRALARKSALNARARENAIIVDRLFDYDAPKTSKLVVSLLGALGVAGKKVLILTDGVKPNVYLSGRNLQRHSRSALLRRLDLPCALVRRRDRRVYRARYTARDRRREAARSSTEAETSHAGPRRRAQTAKAATKTQRAQVGARRRRQAAAKSAKKSAKAAARRRRRNAAKKKGK